MCSSALLSDCSVQAYPSQRIRPLLLRFNRIQPASLITPDAALVRELPVKAASVTLQVTILPELLNSLQQSLAECCGKVVDILGVEPVPRTQSVRVRFAIASASVNAAMAAIIRVLPSGEIGRIVAR